MALFFQKGGIEYIGYNWSQVVPKVTEKPIGKIIRALGSPVNVCFKIHGHKRLFSVEIYSTDNILIDGFFGLLLVFEEFWGNFNLSKVVKA